MDYASGEHTSNQGDPALSNTAGSSGDPSNMRRYCSLSCKTGGGYLACRHLIALLSAYLRTSHGCQKNNQTLRCLSSFSEHPFGLRDETARCTRQID